MRKEDAALRPNSLGLSTVHVNEVFKSLRLKQYAEFDPRYLHMERRPESRTQGLASASTRNGLADPRTHEVS